MLKANDSQKNVKTYKEGLDEVSKARYVQKLGLIGDCDPYEMEKSEWNLDVKEWPDIAYPDIVNYLVNGVSAYSFQDMKAYKSLDAYNQFVCGWVKDIRNATISGRCLMTAKVKHSQRLRDTPLRPWIVAEKDGQVLVAHCDCMAGLSEACSHVGALLFAIDASVKLRNSATVTQEKAYWLPASVEKAPYSTVQNIDFTSAKSKKRKLDALLNSDIKVPRTPKPVKIGEIPPPKPEDDKRFFDALSKSGSKPVLLSLIPGYADSYVPKVLDQKYPVVLIELRDETHITSSREILQNYCEHVYDTLMFTETEAGNVEELTREQADSKSWFRFRAGRITASKVKAVCLANLDQPSHSLVKAICYPLESRFKSKQTEWGCQHEKMARTEYVARMSGAHTNFVLTNTGFNLNPKFPYLGASPDGLVRCDCCGEGCVEIKCPYCNRNGAISSEKNKYLSESDGQLALKENHQYYFQIQCQLLVTDRDYCDFVVWTNTDYFYERISPNEKVQMQIQEKSKAFFKKVILPELVGKLQSRCTQQAQHCQILSAQSQTQSDAAHNKSSKLIICTCQSIYNEETDNVIGCDNQNCPYQWFHYKCAKIKKIPKGSWFCKECKSLLGFKK